MAQAGQAQYYEEYVRLASLRVRQASWGWPAELSAGPGAAPHLPRPHPGLFRISSSRASRIKHWLRV